MEEKWITLAVRTYQRAMRIKYVLDKNGLDALIHNLNTENPEIAVGVRVRIKEKDLPQALKIVEEMERAWDEEAQSVHDREARSVLIPIELTDQINEVCEYGFYFAHKLHANVVFLHAYITPAYTITSSSTTEINTYSLTDSETIRRIIKSNNADVENLRKIVQSWIDEGKIPDVKFSFELREGVPEDEILSYVKKEKPSLVVMGTCSRKHSGESMIGSVTAEVLEASRVPVFAVSSATASHPKEIKRVAFITNFDQKDLIAIDTMISLFGKENLEIIFIHASERKEQWDEVMLRGIKTYFAEQYAGLKTEYALIDRDDNLGKIRPFIEDSKIDMLALNTRKRSLFTRIFNQGLATKLLFNVDTPLLVMHI